MAEGKDIKKLSKLTEVIVRLRNKYCHQSEFHWNDLERSIQALHSFMVIITDVSNSETLDCLLAMKRLLNWIRDFGNKPSECFIIPMTSIERKASHGPRMVFRQAMDDLVFIGREDCFKDVVRNLINSSTCRHIALHGEDGQNLS